MKEENNRTADELQTILDAAGPSPRDHGSLEMIVARPAMNQRLVLDQAELDPAMGLDGDNWLERIGGLADGSRRNADTQITLMNSRLIQVLAGDRSRWPLAGDQLYVDLDLSQENLPPGQQLAVGQAVLEISAVPHTGCAKFTERYGSGAIRFVNSPEGRVKRRRGVYARVIKPGLISVGDTVTKQRSALRSETS